MAVGSNWKRTWTREEKQTQPGCFINITKTLLCKPELSRFIHKNLLRNKIEKKKQWLSSLLIMEVHGMGWQKLIWGTLIIHIKILYLVMDKPRFLWRSILYFLKNKQIKNYLGGLIFPALLQTPSNRHIFSRSIWQEYQHAQQKRKQYLQQSGELKR